MKVIFLDIDGVLNSTEWNKEHPVEIQDGKFIDPLKVKKLARLVRETGAVIVLHSGWRFWFDEAMMPIREESVHLFKIFQENHLSIMCSTPDLTTDEIRQSRRFSLVKAQEILTWMTEHKEVTHYIVLDDLDLHNDTIRTHQIMTDPAIGLTDEDITKAIHMLK